MGLSPFSSSSCGCYTGGPTESYKKLGGEGHTIRDSNPDPRYFKIERLVTIGAYLIAKIHYPNCTNFEGRKLLVFEGISSKKLRSSGFIDPHFCDKAHIAPIARFEPTLRGWELAKVMCKGGKDA